MCPKYSTTITVIVVSQLKYSKKRLKVGLGNYISSSFSITKPQRVQFKRKLTKDNIIPDILITLMTRAFWRQNTFTFNNPRHLAPKCFQSTSLEVLLPFNVIDPILK